MKNETIPKTAGLFDNEGDINDTPIDAVYIEFIDHMRDALSAGGLDNDKTNELIMKVVVELSIAFAGEMIYVSNQPKDVARRMGAYADYRCSNMLSHIVDRKWGFSRGYTTKLVKQIEERRFERQQTKLNLPNNY